MQDQDVSGTLAALEGRRYWYQTVEVDGAISKVPNPGWETSQFYNGGKWRNFVEPLLPPGLDAFAELGTNAGLFLLYAAERGFKRVIGIEADDTWFAQARFVIDRHRMQAPQTYGRIELMHARLGEAGLGASIACLIRSTCPDLDLKALPKLDIMLMANVLYWVERETCLDFISRLATRARYALVVSVEASAETGGPATLAELRAAFAADWREVGHVPCVEAPGDPAPRPMFSVLFESRHRS